MKILYHHRTLGDGAEGIHVASMVNAFRALGHDVRVTAMIGEQTNVPSKRTRLMANIKNRIPRFLYEGLELGYSVYGYRMLRDYIRNWQPDLIYERYTLFNLAGIMAARRYNIPMVLEVNSPLAYERAQYEHLTWKTAARRCERYVCSNADLVAVVSSPLKQHLVQEGVPENRIQVVPNSAEPEVFRPDNDKRRQVRAQFRIPAGTVVIGFVGILRPWHGVELLLEAITRIKSLNNVRVMIVGDGPSRHLLEEQVRKNDLQCLVTFTGRAKHDEIPKYLAGFDIGVSPRATFYASPMKVPEYMATGVAVVAPRMPNLEDLIQDGTDGLLFEPENVDDLSQKLLKLITNNKLRQKMGRTARQTIVKNKTWQHNGCRILASIANGRA